MQTNLIEAQKSKIHTKLAGADLAHACVLLVFIRLGHFRDVLGVVALQDFLRVGVTQAGHALEQAALELGLDLAHGCGFQKIAIRVLGHALVLLGAADREPGGGRRK